MQFLFFAKILFFKWVNNKSIKQYPFEFGKGDQIDSNIENFTRLEDIHHLYKYRLIHGHFHIGLVIIPRTPYWPETESRANMGRWMVTRPIWKCPCIKRFITYFRHLEKRHSYWPETKLRPILARAIWASIWKWSCSNPITGYFPGVWKYGQFTSGHIDHTKMPLFELSM